MDIVYTYGGMDTRPMRRDNLKFNRRSFHLIIVDACAKVSNSKHKSKGLG